MSANSLKRGVKQQCGKQEELAAIVGTDIKTSL